VATKELEIMKDYTKPATFKGPLGEVDVERVKKIIALLERSKAVPVGALTPEDLVTTSLAPKS
jgi:NitT/TauT family transport system substrate-binding protein